MFTWLLSAVLLSILIVCTAIWMSRPRAVPVDTLEDSGSSQNLTARVGVFVLAPEEEDGVNQYTVPSIASWAATHGYTLRLLDSGSVTEAMLEARHDFDYVVAMSNRVLITKRKGTSLDLVMRQTHLASALEECKTGWFCNNMQQAWEGNDPSVMWRPALSSTMLVVRTGAASAADFLRTVARTGRPGATRGVSPLPSNLLALVSEWDWVSEASPLLGTVCARTDQIRERYNEIPHAFSFPKLARVRDGTFAAGSPPIEEGEDEEPEEPYDSDDDSSSED